LEAGMDLVVLGSRSVHVMGGGAYLERLQEAASKEKGVKRLPAAAAGPAGIKKSHSSVEESGAMPAFCSLLRPCGRSVVIAETARNICSLKKM
jgi:hypothetical protein